MDHREPVAKENPSFPKFEEWARANEVSLDNCEDWIEWWYCWLDGFVEGTKVTLIKR